jgi:hypothetical protein
VVLAEAMRPFVSVRVTQRGAPKAPETATSTAVLCSVCAADCLVCLPAYVSIRQHTSACVSIRQHTAASLVCLPVTSACIRQHTSAYISIRRLAYHERLHTSAYVSIRQHTSAYGGQPIYHERLELLVQHPSPFFHTRSPLNPKP